MRTVPDTGMVDFIIVAAIWRAQNIVQEFERLPKWGEISAVPPIYDPRQGGHGLISRPHRLVQDVDHGEFHP